MTAPDPTTMPDFPVKRSPLIQTNIDKLRLPIFIECLVTGQYEGLIISGLPSHDDLVEAWHKIYGEYVERVGGISVAAVLNREKEIMQICSRYDRVMMLVYIARNLVCCKEIEEAFDSEGFTFDSTAEDAVRERQLLLIEAYMKPELLRLGKLNTAKESQQEKGKPHKHTWQEFNDLLARMSAGEGFQLRADNLTLGEFCSYLMQHRERIEKANRPRFSK